MVTLHPNDSHPKATLEMIELFEDLRRLQRDSINAMHSRKRIADLLGITEGLNQTEVAKVIGTTKQQLGAARRTASDFNSVMSTLPPAKHGPVTAVDLTAKRKKLREECYVPQAANGSVGAGTLETSR